MADTLYTLEKLAEAVDALVTGAGRIRERLFEAAVVLIRIRREAIPDGDLRRAFDDVMNTLKSEPAEGDEGTITATLRTKNADEAGTIARRIFELYLRLDRLDT